MKRVTKTKTETTIYDTNGKVVSIVRKDITVIEPNIVLGREETNHLKERVLINREQLEKQLEFSQSLSETRSKTHKESNKVYQNTHKKPKTENLNRPKVFYHLGSNVEGISPISVASLIWEAAESFNIDPIFQQGPTKKTKRQRS